MIDIHTIGAGGGSVASIDEGRSLRVGPNSAGARPGPACYGLGGTEPTVTDANMLLGRLPVTTLGSDITLDTEQARQAINTLALKLNLSIQKTALGIIQLAEEHMVRALQVISIERGHDPADFTLMCFGGAGGLHVCALAERLGTQRIVLPIHAGVFSALGMLVSSPARQLVRTISKPLRTEHLPTLEATYAALISEAVSELTSPEGDSGESQRTVRTSRTLDLRYEGQSFTLNLPWPATGGEQTGKVIDINDLTMAFHQAHKQRYGHKFDLTIEVVNLHVEVSIETDTLQLPLENQDTRDHLAEDHLAEDHAAEHRHEQREIVDRNGQRCMVPVLDRRTLAGRLAGPALIIDSVATSYLADGWLCEKDQWGHLHFSAQGADADMN